MRANIGKLVSVGLVALLSACGGGSDGGTPPADVNTMTKNAGDGQSATVGTAVATPPSIKITNQANVPVANVAVTFAVGSGGGQITGGSTTTNASGIATVGSWTMGTTTGANTLTASAAGVNGSPVTFTVNATAGPPKTITKQAGDNQTASPSEAVPVKPAVKVVDQFGNPNAGVTVTFAVASGGGTVAGGTATTDAAGVATAGDWTLGSAQGANTLTATVTGTGVTGNPVTFTATAQFVALTPTSSTTISGNKTYSSVNIPAGVTVTIATDAVITVLGDYTQAGIVTAPCHNLKIDAGGIFTATGNISNDCATADIDGVDLVLIGRGGYNISNNQVASSGDIWIMDGPTLALPAVSARTRVAPNVVAEAGPYRCRLVNMQLLARPLTKAKKPTKTPKGDPGSSGTSRTSGCGQLLTGQFGGNMLVDGITMVGGSGGDGGDGTSTTSTTSEGGVGGEPGALNLVSDGDIDIQGTVTLTLGNGGNGGNATSTVAAAGVAATALGGKGSGLKPRNFSSPVTIQSKHGSLTIFGTLKVEFGNAGAGGTATATGGNGAAGNPGQKGGDATANGGNGGDAEPWQLSAAGNIIIFGTVNVTGGAGGAGGGSNRNPGAGGAGNVPGAAGGAGGNALGRAGNGGKGQPAPAVVGVAAASVLQSPGGAAGSSTSSGGKGGDGAPNCPGTGGAGGKGGDASGGGGERGPGFTQGAAGTVTFNSFGNGGNGKAGNGAAGAGGANTTTIAPSATGVVAAPGSFQPGTPGGPCPTSNVNVNLAVSTPQLAQGVVTPGTYSVQLVNAATNAVVGAMNFIASATAFYGSTPPRVGWSTGSWTADLGSAVVDGAPWKFTSWRVCIINTTVSANAPVLVEELDANQNVVAFREMSNPTGISGRMVTSLTPCQDFVLQLVTRYIRLRMTGMGSSADANGFGGTGGPTGSLYLKQK